MSAVNTTGIALSAASLAIQLGEIGYAAMGLPSESAKDPSALSSLRLAMKHEIEQTLRLRRVLNEEGKFGLNRRLLDEMDDATRTDMREMFEQVDRILLEYKQLEDKYALKDKPGHQDVEMANVERGDGNDRVTPATSLSRSRADNDRLERLVAESSSWNIRIERAVKSFQWLHAVSSPSPATAISRLGEIAKDADAKQLGWAEIVPLKQILLAMNNPDISRDTLPIPKNLDMGNGSGSLPVKLAGKRTEGVVDGLVGRESVLVEFRRYLRSATDQVLDDSRRRVEHLTALLTLRKDPGFRLPIARGYYHDKDNCQFGIVFSERGPIGTPKTQQTTLNALLADGKRPSLSARLKLSCVLAQSLSKLQFISWVHQGIQSEHILFITYGNPEIQYHLPFLFGFGNSRPDSEISNQVYDDDPVRNLYRHPERWGLAPSESFNKLHDIYSLGVILLEIAFWRPVKKLVKKELITPKAHAVDVKANLLELAKDKHVEDSMGERFGGVLIKCLDSVFGVDLAQDDKEDSMLQKAFRIQVVTVLEKATESIGYKADS